MTLSSSPRPGNTEWRSLRATLMTSTSYSSWTHRGKLSSTSVIDGHAIGSGDSRPGAMNLGEAPEETESRWLVKTNKKDTRAASKFQPGSGASVKPNHVSSASQSTVTVASTEPDRVRGP